MTYINSNDLEDMAEELEEKYQTEALVIGDHLRTLAHIAMDKEEDEATVDRAQFAFDSLDEIIGWAERAKAKIMDWKEEL